MACKDMGWHGKARFRIILATEPRLRARVRRHGKAQFNIHSCYCTMLKSALLVPRVALPIIWISSMTATSKVRLTLTISMVQLTWCANSTSLRSWTAANNVRQRRYYLTHLEALYSVPR